MDLITEASDKYFEAYNYLYEKLTTLSDEINNSEADFENIALLVSEIKSLFDSLVESFKSLIKEIRINLIYLTTKELLTGYKNYIFKCFDYSEIEGEENLSDKKVLDDYNINEHEITPDKVIVIAGDVLTTNSNIMQDMKDRILHEFEYEKNLRNEDYSSNLKRPDYVKNIIIYKTFDEIFKPKYRNKIDIFIKLLQTGNKPVLDEDGNYINGRLKQAFVAWYEALSGEKGIIINMTNRDELARLLNEKFPGLDISGSSCRGIGPLAKSYEDHFNAGVAAIKGNLSS